MKECDTFLTYTIEDPPLEGRRYWQHPSTQNALYVLDLSIKYGLAVSKTKALDHILQFPLGSQCRSKPELKQIEKINLAMRSDTESAEHLWDSCLKPISKPFLKEIDDEQLFGN